MSFLDDSHRDPIDGDVFAQVADHTLLANGTTSGEVENFLAAAREIGVARVCISPSLLPVDKAGLEIVTVVGFPSGAHHAETKGAETRRAVADGADEIDMVLNHGLVRAGDWTAVAEEIRAVREACPGKVLKVIIESATLDDEQIVTVCRTVQASGAEFVKTSTGFHPAGGATVHAVRLIAQTVGHKLGVKASGGVRTAAEVRELWVAGATRFGVSATASILSQFRGGQSSEPVDEENLRY